METEKTSEIPAQISTFLVDMGIALQMEDGEGKKIAVLSPEDIGRVTISLISNAVLYQFNEMLRKAAEQQEFERIRQKVESGQIIVPK